MSGGRVSTRKTVTPGYVPLRLLVGTAMLAVLLIWIFGEFWGSVLLLVSLAMIRPAFHPYTVPFTISIVQDGITKQFRCLRAGLNWIAPGESIVRTINLKKHVGQVGGEQEAGKEAEKETYPSKLGKILASYFYAMFPDDSTDESILTFASFEEEAIQQAGEATFSRMLSDYFASVKEGADESEVTDKEMINNTLFGEDHEHQTERVAKFARRHGVSVHEVGLVDVDFDENVQKYRNALASIKSFADGVKALRKSGMSKEDAEKTMRLIAVENTHENIFTVDVSGLENAEHISIGYVPGAGGSKPNKPKGGEK